MAHSVVAARRSNRVWARIAVHCSTGSIRTGEYRLDTFLAIDESCWRNARRTDGQSLTRMPDWFVARAHVERNCPIDLQTQRDGQHLRLQLVITDPSFHTWNKAQHDSVLAFYLARLILLSLAILIAFSRSQQQLPVTRRKPGTLRLRVGRFAQAQLIGSLQLASTSGSWPRSLAETSM